MSDVRCYDDILKTLEKDKAYYEDYLYLLNKVKYKRKKDGSIFANINNNFENGKITIKSYNDSRHPSFVVSGICPSDNRFTSYDFDAYLYIDDIRKENPQDERIQGLKDTDGFYRNTYLLTVSEIEEKIENEKNLCIRKIANYEKQIEQSKKIFESVFESVNVLKNLIKDSCKELRDDSIFPSSLEYALQDYAKNNLR